MLLAGCNVWSDAGTHYRNVGLYYSVRSYCDSSLLFLGLKVHLVLPTCTFYSADRRGRSCILVEAGNDSIICIFRVLFHGNMTFWSVGWAQCFQHILGRKNIRKIVKQFANGVAWWIINSRVFLNVAINSLQNLHSRARTRHGCLLKHVWSSSFTFSCSI